MKPLTELQSWETVSKKAYWDRDVSLKKWREMVAVGHPSYLPDAVSGMDVPEFVHYYGAQRFIADWPLLRTRLPDKVARNACLHDVAWSRLVGGGWNLRPSVDFTAMPQRRRQFLVAVCKSPGRNIYEVANSLGMQYRRAHEHAVSLMQDGKIRGRQVVDGGRRKTKLYPAYG
jgi:hypothetical protein